MKSFSAIFFATLAVIGLLMTATIRAALVDASDVATKSLRTATINNDWQRQLAAKRLWALSMLESGGNDHCIGPCREVSRYQITPRNWKDYSLSGEEPAQKRDARAVLARILQIQIARFVAAHHRAPTDFEFYLLWHCPSHVNHPNAAESDLARRFVNLCSLRSATNP